MALTALMFVILIVGYGLMVALVKFTETVIARPEIASPDDRDTARARGGESGT